MKKVYLLFILFSCYQILFAQQNKAYFDFGFHVGGNFQNNYENPNLEINAYNGIVLGGYTGINKSKFGLKLVADYLPSSFTYTFKHPENSNYHLNFNKFSSVISYGLDIKFKLYEKYKNQFFIFLGLQLMNEIGLNKNDITNKYYNEYYDNVLQENNKRIMLAVVPTNQNRTIYSNSIGFEYARIIKNRPFYVQFSIIFIENDIINNNREISFLAFDQNNTSEVINNRYDLMYTSGFRLKLGTQLYRTRK